VLQRQHLCAREALETALHRMCCSKIGGLPSQPGKQKPLPGNKGLAQTKDQKNSTIFQNMTP
jgi:hypothetical protein